MTAIVAPRPSERGWWKLLLALAAFLFLPAIPQLRALLPVEQTLLLLTPAIAACALVGWWAGGRVTLALVWIGLALLMASQRVVGPSAAFFNLARGWSLLIAGAFGLVCLFGIRRRFFSRALVALTVALTLAVMLGAVGPVSLSEGRSVVVGELARRNGETMNALRAFIGQHPREWQQVVDRLPALATLPTETEKQLGLIARAGVELFPALLALQSLCALALAWATYHRIARARLGVPLGALRDFRFNDQLVWGLIVGLTFVLLPAFEAFQTAGRNLLIFFGALYAIRGLGVLSWFLAPGALAATLTIGFAMLWWPILNLIAAFGFLLLALAAFGLGLGDTWADWRRRARSTT